jgi:hypothetical protein
MVHHGQGLPLGLEAGDHLPRVHAELDDLERHPAVDGRFLFGHVDDAEAPLTDLLEDLVRADPRSRAFRHGAALDDHLRGRLLVGSQVDARRPSVGVGQQGFHFGPQVEGGAARLVQKRRALGRVERPGLVKELFDLLEPFGLHRCHLCGRAFASTGIRGLGGARPSPVTLWAVASCSRPTRGQRDVQGLGDLGHREPPDHLHLDHVRLPLVQGLQAVEGIDQRLDADQGAGPRAPTGLRVLLQGQRDALAVAAALGGAAPALVVNQHAQHHLGGDGEELAPIVVLVALLAPS